MYGTFFRELTDVKQQLNDIIENQSELLLDTINSKKLQHVVQTNVLDKIAETIEEIDLIFDNIEGREYGNLDE